MRYKKIVEIISKDHSKHNFEQLTDTELKDILLFGDNFSGDAVGFLTTDNWSIVEIWHDDDLSINPGEEKTFEEFANGMFEKFIS